MKLFWKIFIAVLTAFIIVVSLMSYVTSTRNIFFAKKEVIDRNRLISDLTSREIEINYLKSQWPLEILERMTEREDFLFWWIVTDDGMIYLADDASFIQTYAYDYFPKIIAKDEVLFLSRDQDFGILVKPLEIGEKKWSFWLGFSLKEVAGAKKAIILTEVEVSGLALALLGTMLFFIIRRFTNPIVNLKESADRISKGNLDERIEVKNRDEVGELGEAFNKMVESLIEMNIDITERKELEKQRLESNKRLQRLAQKLIIARDELKVAIETKGEFMNIAAHELRTPLQPIIGYADRLLQENNPTDWQKERLNIILDNAKRLLKLVQDLLDINKMETGIMKFAMAEVDLLVIIKEIHQSFKPVVEAKKLKFILDISETPGPIKVEGDPNKLNQVFSNLLDNAIKFTDKGGITIQVKEGKNTATVSFKDTGNGIAKKYMPQLFTKFFQADGTDKRKVGGTGLGLAICKEIVKVHKGKISAQSTQGKGSTFQVILPKLTRPTKRKGVENGQNFGSRR